MDGILVINKPKGITSRDAVNRICKILNTKKVGHTGTLDPIAEGVLVIAIGKATKLVEEITSSDKEYIATVKLGLLTDSLDLDGKIIQEEKVVLEKKELEKVLKSFVGFYEQQVPIYSAVKINGKKLYEYARENKDVKLPYRKVEIKKIELLDFNKEEYKFKVSVSKGTYIRSLIKDINDKLGIIGSMSSLVRIKQGIYNIEDSLLLEQLNENTKLISIKEALKKYNCIKINDDFFDVIKNGALIDNIYDTSKVVFIYNNEVIAIYKTYDKDNRKMKPYKMFV